ncbi:hypothetical protein [Actinosynnema mirum]|uniref:Uncharacterized protein n=1 Tax=Actinosynnema mirum (strain ATCC 29888 / DSM 43827 / JCM 3225 / NBRC 14064 / NCIMB 13271 / NRRL B-12336 / IMRU 3971 / 101) TaxID=446462 RepID=C6WB93_ACTMD|nr:hypothetical protein [Actinosynnema mirum]ACU39384.1 hypothetical protein Amir_5566 [Actinosynnema mirum DSM 43827]
MIDFGTYALHPDSTCWAPHCHRPTPADQHGLIPRLCSEPCRADWVASYGLSSADTPATHVVEGQGWVPFVQAMGVVPRQPEAVARPITEIAPAREPFSSR